MRRALTEVERWGPLAIALIALLTVIGVARSLSERAARLEGLAEGLQQQINQRTQIEIALRTEVQTWQAHVVALRVKLVEAGVQDVPPPPEAVTQP